MNTLTSVVLLSLLVVFSQGINVSVQWGKNITLEGPPEKPVEWLGPKHTLCKGSEVFYRQLNHTCNEQNLTLLFVNSTFNGDYYGYRKDNMGVKKYTVTVIPPPASTRKPLSKPKHVFVSKGDNITLEGPPGTPVEWLGGKHTLCKGSQVMYKQLNHTCNEQNLTLLFVNASHNGVYIGYNKDGTDRHHYEVSVLDFYPNSGHNLAQEKPGKGKPKQKDRTNLEKKSEQHKPKDDVQNLDFPSGSNQTLVGPPGSKVDWYTTKNGDFTKLCDGLKGPNDLCNYQNLTLRNVSRKDEGGYFGSNEQSKHYRVTVYTKPRNQTKRIQPYTTKGTTKGTTKLSSGNHSFELQLADDQSNQQDQQIPPTTVAIVVGVIAGFITIIIVILCYICCRKRPRAYNNMVDPLLSFSY